MRKLIAVSIVAASLSLGPAVASGSSPAPTAKMAGVTYCTNLTVGKICSTILNRKWMRVCTYVYSGSMVAKRCRKVRR